MHGMLQRHQGSAATLWGNTSCIGDCGKKRFLINHCPCRMSAKLFKCTPQQLPGDLKANLLAMLQCGVNALEGYIRPGCLHLTLNAMVG